MHILRISAIFPSSQCSSRYRSQGCIRGCESLPPVITSSSTEIRPPVWLGSWLQMVASYNPFISSVLPLSYQQLSCIHTRSLYNPLAHLYASSTCGGCACLSVVKVFECRHSSICEHEIRRCRPRCGHTRLRPCHGAACRWGGGNPQTPPRYPQRKSLERREPGES